jgi:hypothetical protein
VGGDFTRVTEPENVLTWGAMTYVKRMMTNFEQMFGVPAPKREVHAPLEPGDHPLVDESQLLEGQDIKNYWQMIGELQWAVALRRIDIMGATVETMVVSGPHHNHNVNASQLNNSEINPKPYTLTKP